MKVADQDYKISVDKKRESDKRDVYKCMLNIKIQKAFVGKDKFSVLTDWPLSAINYPRRALSNIINHN
jgi:hypothetical protein